MIVSVIYEQISEIMGIVRPQPNKREQLYQKKFKNDFEDFLGTGHI